MSQSLAQQLSSLAESTRLRLLRVLERQELTVVELCSVLRLPQSTASRHLKVLADEGWVESRRDGTSRLYRFSAERLPAGALRLWEAVRGELGAELGAAEDEARLRAVLRARAARSQSFFATAAGQWDRLRDELVGERAGLGALLGLLDPAWTIGDLGCGTGHTADALAPFVRRVIAVDSSPAMLEAARTRLGGVPNVELREGGLEALPLADRELDAAVVMLVLHHLGEPATAFAELARVVRPGGTVLVVEMAAHEREEYRHQMGHVWLGFAPEQLAGWLAASGFERVACQPLPVDPAARGPALLVARAVRRRGAGVVALSSRRKTRAPRRVRQSTDH